MRDLTSVGQKLRALREKKGLTLAEVADAVDKSTSLVGSVERADRCPSLPSLIELAEFYQVPLASLFEDDLNQYHIQVARLIQNIMTEKNISIGELANKTEINYFHLADYFQGRIALSLEQLKKVASALEISMKQIIPETARYINHIQHYLRGLGLDEQSIQNIVDYIYSKFEL